MRSDSSGLTLVIFLVHRRGAFGKLFMCCEYLWRRKNKFQSVSISIG